MSIKIKLLAVLVVVGSATGLLLGHARAAQLPGHIDQYSAQQCKLTDTACLDNSAEAFVYRVTWATLDRESGNGYFVNNLVNQGASNGAVANAFLLSTEYKTKFGNDTDSQFITHIYTFVVKRAPTSQEMLWYTTVLRNGTKRVDVLVAVVNAQETMNVQHAAFVKFFQSSPDVAVANPTSPIITSRPPSTGYSSTDSSVTGNKATSSTGTNNTTSASSSTSNGTDASKTTNAAPSGTIDKLAGTTSTSNQQPTVLALAKTSTVSRPYAPITPFLYSYRSCLATDNNCIDHSSDMLVYLTYRAILKHEPVSDDNYQAYTTWLAALVNRTDSKVVIADFLNSSGGQASVKESQPAFVDQLSQQLLAKAPTINETAAWQKSLAQDNANSRANLLIQFVAQPSVLTANHDAFMKFAKDVAGTVYKVPLPGDAFSYSYQRCAASSNSCLDLSAESLVYGAYLAAVNRAPVSTDNYANYQSYVSNILNHGKSAEATVESIISTTGGKANLDGLSNSDFVKKIYKELWDTTPTADRLTYWKDQLDSNQTNRSDLILTFIGQPDIRNHNHAGLMDFLGKAPLVGTKSSAGSRYSYSFVKCLKTDSNCINFSKEAMVFRLYQLILNRAPVADDNYAAYRSWVNELINGGQKPAAVVDAFLNKAPSVSASQASLINALYTYGLGASPTAANLKDWGKQISDTSRSDVVIDFLSNPTAIRRYQPALTKFLAAAPVVKYIPPPPPDPPKPAAPKGSASVPAPSFTPCAQGHPSLQQGSSGPCVQRLQQLLNFHGGYGLATDGNFGPGTTAAVKNYQAAHGLSIDGLVGNQTWTYLETGTVVGVGGDFTPPAGSGGGGTIAKDPTICEAGHCSAGGCIVSQYGAICPGGIVTGPPPPALTPSPPPLLTPKPAPAPKPRCLILIPCK